MRGFLYVLGVLCLSLSAVQAVRLTSLQTPASKLLLVVRGGAGGKRGGGGSARGSSRRKVSDDDDEDADDEDDEDAGGDDDDNADDEDEEERSRSSSSSKRKGSSRRAAPSKSKSSAGSRKRGGKKGRGGKSSRRNRNQLVKWGETYGKASAGLRANLKEKFEELAKQGQTVYKDAYRRAKVLRSSAFEAMLLKATWPGDDAVPQDLLDEIIRHSIPAFKYGRASGEDDPYHMTMHKLWTKMCEKDWRTVVKSLYILHCVSRDCSVDACSRFALAIKDMSKVRNPKNPEHRYFDVSLIKEVDDASAPYEAFVGAYGSYVLFRSKTFSSKFEELKEISDQTHEKNAVARLKRAVHAMQLGLKCTIDDRDQQNLITGHATRQIANDLKDCWKHFTSKLAPLAGDEGVTAYGGTKADEKDVVALLQFYRDSGKEIKSYLSKSLKAFGPMRIKVPSEIESKFLPAADFEEKLSARVAALTTSISGGAVGAGRAGAGRPSARKIAKPLDDDEDDEEEGAGAGEDEDEEGEEEGGDDDEEGDDAEDSQEDDEGEGEGEGEESEDDGEGDGDDEDDEDGEEDEDDDDDDDDQ